MCDFDDKYFVLKFILNLKKFSFVELQDSIQTSEPQDAIYAVIGELLDKGLITDTGAYSISRTGSLCKVYSVTDERLSELHELLERFNLKRINPDSVGKPMGLSFRAAEQMIKKVEKSNSLDNDILNCIEKYLALAQAEEMSVQTSDKDIVEGHLRYLYAKYLKLRGFYENAIVQLIQSAYLFKNKNLLQEEYNTESEACLLYLELYKRAFKAGQADLINELVEFGKLTERLLSTIERISPKDIILHYIMRSATEKLSETIDELERSKGEFISVVRHGWCLYKDQSNQSTAKAYELINKAKLILMSRRSWSSASPLIEEASTLLKSHIKELSSPELDLLKDINKLRISMQTYQLFDDLYNLISKEGSSSIEIADELGKLEYEGLFPFYIADTLEKVKAAVTLVIKKYNLLLMNSIKVEFVDTVQSEWAEHLHERTKEGISLDPLQQNLVEIPYSDFSTWGSSKGFLSRSWFMDQKEEFQQVISLQPFTQDQKLQEHAYHLFEGNKQEVISEKSIGRIVQTANLLDLLGSKVGEFNPVISDVSLQEARENRKRELSFRFMEPSNLQVVWRQ